MSASDPKARELLFDNVNRDAIMNVHCVGTSDRIAEEFQCRGFADVRSFPVPGFEAPQIQKHFEPGRPSIARSPSQTLFRVQSEAQRFLWPRLQFARIYVVGLFLPPLASLPLDLRHPLRRRPPAFSPSIS
jgi:hypothetical protein